jgi:hypothetical protein
VSGLSNRRPSQLLAAVLSMSVVTSSASAHAQTKCAPTEGASPALAAIDAETRLDFLRSVMRDQAHRARLWMWSWALGGVALSAGNFGIAALAKTSDDRIDPLTSGVTSLTIPLGILVKPLRVTQDQEALETYVATMSTPVGSIAPCLQVARAEELLSSSADDEAFGTGVLAHGFAVVGNGAVALFLGLGFKHWGGALLNGVGGFLITEAQIFTQPSGAVHARDAYNRGNLTSFPVTRGATQMTWALAPLSVAGGQGIAVVGAF